MNFDALDLRGLDVVDRVHNKVLYLSSLGWGRDINDPEPIMVSPDSRLTFNMVTEEVSTI
jgi:hypothetical protein